MIAFLPGSASSSLLEESISGFRLAKLCLMHEAQEKLASELMSLCWRLELPHCVTRPVASASSGVTEGLNEERERDVSGTESCFILAGVTALSRDSVKILSKFLLGKRANRARILKQQKCSFQKYSNGLKTDISFFLFFFFFFFCIWPCLKQIKQVNCCEIS